MIKKFYFTPLTHPIWWTTPGKLNAAEKIDFHLKKKYDSIKVRAKIANLFYIF